MPNSEFAKKKNTSKNIPLVFQGLEVYLIFSCPVCGCWTLHAPRLNEAGYWYVDHKRENVYAKDDRGNDVNIGQVPLESCLVDDNIGLINIARTRTVIRVN